MKSKRPLTFTAWIALSADGHPAPFLGMAFTRSDLKKDYTRRFTSDFDVAGYRAVKVRVSGLVPARTS